MNPVNMTNRRKMLLASGAVATAAAIPGRSFGDDAPTKNPICVFTKPFNSLSHDELADKIAELGFDGIEAPIRPGGHIEPKNVEKELPKLVEALAKRNLKITVLTSDINDPKNPLSKRVIRTAATLGIKRYRMKYLKYDLDQPITDQLDAWKPQMEELAALNHDFGIQGLYQNHAGEKYLGSAIWDLRELLAKIDPQDIGVAYDIRHATVEGANSWPVTFDIIKPHVTTVYVKDFRWDGKKVVNVPLGTGNVNPAFFEILKKTGFTGPISLHEEYLNHRDPDLVPKHWVAIKNDLKVLKQMLS